MNRFRKLLLGSVVAWAALLPLTAFASLFNGIVVFGDSLTDDGNNAAVFDSGAVPGVPPGTRQPTPIPSNGFIPGGPPYVSNRYSNGPVWVEQLAAALGLPLGPSLLGGTDFAFGGARTGPAGSTFPYNLVDQVSMFLPTPASVAPSSFLYVVGGGGNDARDALATALGGGNPASQIAAYGANVAQIVTRLSLAGADQFLITNVPDLGLLPSVQALPPIAIATATAIAAAFNGALAGALAVLPANVRDGIHVVDLFSLLDNAVADPAAFGLTDVTSACAFSAACVANPDGTFFWDGIHPTTVGHSIIARAAIEAIPEPATLLLLVLGLGLLLSASNGRLRRAPL